MKVSRSLHEVGGIPSPVVTVGNFDGVHRGHQEIFRRVRARATAWGAPSLVMTLHPHPAHVLGSRAGLWILTDLDEKVRQIAASGVDHLFVLGFNRKTASMGPREFIRRYIVEGLHARHLFVGYDFFFGHDRSGDIPLLRKLSREFGFGLTVVPRFRSGRIAVKSSLIRKLLTRGDVATARRLLGRPFALQGRVRKGRGLGRQIGFATANLEVGSTLVPGRGVYAVRAFSVGAVRGFGRIRSGVMNIGLNPTVGGKQQRLEVHIFGWARALYGRTLRVEFVSRLRGERKFASLQALSRAIERDVIQARKVFSRERTRRRDRV